MRKYAAQTHPENRTSRPPQRVGTLFQLFALTNAVSSPFPLLLAVTHSLGAATCFRTGSPTFLSFVHKGNKALRSTPERAERLFRQQEEGAKALNEYQAKEEARRRLTAKLRAERLAREASPKRKRTAAKVSAD